MGKLTRKAPVGALTETAGPKFAWMGAFIALVTSGILFYYSVVVGWGFRYFFYSLSGLLTKTADYQLLWDNYTHSLQPLFFHILALFLGCFVIYRGVAKGIEKTNTILVPALIGMILIIAVRAVTLPGASKGLAYFFTPHLSDLLHYRIWIEALTQNAWDTGAGWGLLLVYANYARKNESINANGCLTALANNGVSIIMGVIIFGAAFAFESYMGLESLTSGEASTNTGLTFIYLPTLFSSLPGGSLLQTLFATLFFLAFALGALSSMISMIQLSAKALYEMGLSHKQAILSIAFLALVFGAPSALNMAFLENQDSVWSLGLVLNGLFIAFGVIRYGVNRFRIEAVNSSNNDFKVGKIYNFMIRYLIPFQGIVLIAWYFYQSISEMQDGRWWNPFHVYSLGTIVFQWGTGILFFIFVNKWLAKKALAQKA